MFLPLCGHYSDAGGIPQPAEQLLAVFPRHIVILRSLAAFIHRVFLMGFDQTALIVLRLLPETPRFFAGIHFLQASRQPAHLPGHIQPATPAPVGQVIPLPEFLLILRSRSHRQGGCLASGHSQALL